MQIRKRPYNLLLLTGFILVVVSFLVLNQSNPVDIHLHDTYFVVALTYIFWLLAILAFIVWTVYLVTNKLLYSKVLTWTHVIIKIITLGLFASSLVFGDSFSNPAPRHYYDYSGWNSLDMYSTFAKTIAITIFVLLFGQIIFIINFIAGLFKRKP